MFGPRVTPGRTSRGSATLIKSKAEPLLQGRFEAELPSAPAEKEKVGRLSAVLGVGADGRVRRSGRVAQLPVVRAAFRGASRHGRAPAVTGTVIPPSKPAAWTPVRSSLI